MKITKYFLSLAAAVGMIAGCQKPEMVQISAPEDVVAPVLESVSDINITAENLGLEKVTFNWSAADFGAQTQVNYAIEVAIAGKDDKIAVTSGITETTAEVTYEALNAILLYDLELTSGVATKVDYYVSAKVGEYAKVYSAPVTASATVTAAEKQYPKLYVVGSYNSWSHDSSQYLFDFIGDDTVYQGMIDFGTDHASNEFKITAGDWGNDEHSMNGPHDAETKTIAMVAGGGDNINVWQAKRYYHLTFDRALTMTADVSFDQIGVIGDFNSWGADVVMEFNAKNQKFYADVEFPADGGFKFRLDADWAVSYGTGANGFLTSDNGGNISATAGKYRIYLNMNNFGEMTYELNTAMYGQPEDTGSGDTPDVPEVPEVKGWGLIGDFNGWGADLGMTQSGAIWSAKNVDLATGQGWKLRKDGDWAVNVGAPGDVEPFTVTVGEALDVVAGGKNLSVPADGTYDIYFDEGNNKLYVLTAGAAAPEFADTWFMIGGFCNWATDSNYMMAKEGDYWVFKGFTLDAANEVKFNVGNWNTQRGSAGGAFSANTALPVSGDGGSGNIAVPAGTYDVYLDLANDKAYFMTDGKTPADAGEAEIKYIDASNVVVGLSGTFNGWGDPTPAAFDAKDVTDAATFAGKYTYKLTGFELANGAEFKIRVNGEWIGAGGATVEGIAVSGTDNFLVGEGGTFNVAITFTWDGLKPSEVKAVFSK